MSKITTIKSLKREGNIARIKISSNIYLYVKNPYRTNPNINKKTNQLA